jgi:hypothetical protein
VTLCTRTRMSLRINITETQIAMQPSRKMIMYHLFEVPCEYTSVCLLVDDVAATIARGPFSYRATIGATANKWEQVFLQKNNRLKIKS